MNKNKTKKKLTMGDIFDLTLPEIKAMPTLYIRKASDLKYEDKEKKLWLSAKCDNEISIELYSKKKKMWLTAFDAKTMLMWSNTILWRKR